MKSFADTLRYESNGYTYYLMPSGELKRHGWRVLFAEMYTGHGNYVGVWNRAEMPLKVIRALEAHLKYLSLFVDEDTSNSE